jgi:uncharacterized repeat protein (TIGR03803 family)
MVFRITPAGELTPIYSFCYKSGCADGSLPYAGLIQATNGNFYGTTASGGANGGGTVFEITPGGTLTTLYSFCSQTNCTDGQEPYAGLVQAGNGYLYGTTSIGGANGNYGTVFKISPKFSPSVTLKTLYSFCSQIVSGICTDGQYPYAALVQGAQGHFYGTTPSGGANQAGAVFEFVDENNLSTLYSFCPPSTCADGAAPYPGLVQGSDGNFYGTTPTGGVPGGNGNAFVITPSGSLSNLYTFCTVLPCAGGAQPSAGLVQGTDGNFYGTTKAGGAGYGTVFSLSVGLGPFVETRPTSGKVGSVVKILGTDLTGASSVTFNGTAATLTVVSRYLITTTVPVGASTGKVEVATPSGTLSSNVSFRVRP